MVQTGPGTYSSSNGRDAAALMQRQLVWALMSVDGVLSPHEIKGY